MPPPKKLDLIPEEVLKRLEQVLVKRGFGQIVETTDDLNAWLSDEGLELTIGKTAVGEHSKMLKDQRAAFSLAETLLSDMDIDAETDLHKVLLQMIATSAVQMMKSVREGDGHLDPKDLMNLGRMLKDLMSSVGIREKITADERKRLKAEALEEARTEVADAMDGVMTEAGLAADMIGDLRTKFLGLKT